MRIDVLFVDDDLPLAQNWAEYVEELMGLSTYATDSPSDAMDIVANEGVKIAILDQRMPAEDGTSLGERIRKRDPFVVRVLMSGEADSQETATAYNIGFERVVHKNAALTELPSLISRYLVQYQAQLARSVERQEISFERKVGWFSRRQRIAYRLLSIDNINKEYIFDDSWKSRAKVDAGESIEVTTSVTWTRTDDVKIETSVRGIAELGLTSGNGDKINAALKAELTKRVQQSISISRQTTVAVKKSFSLPEEPSDPSQKHVKARAYQVAPVFARIDATVACSCSCCGQDTILRVVSYLPTSRYATRHVDYYSDGEHRESATGIEDV